jgi:hypothetical protein
LGWDEFKQKGTWVNIRSDLEKHLVRGLIDGDGWVTQFKCWNRKKTKCWIYPVIGFCNEFKEPINQVMRILHLKCKINPVKSKTSKKNIWGIVKTGNDCSRIYKLLYSDATVWLTRKRIKLESLL